MASLKTVSIFSGIGGFELGLADSNIEPLLICEKDKYARNVLNARFPGVVSRHDVRRMRSLPNCDLLVAGWPCQDLSQAGKTAGITGESSSIVNEVFRLMDASKKKPRWVLLENVAFALHLRKGEAVSQVVSALQSRGYAWAYRILNSAEFGSPQRRRRIFILASLDGDPSELLFAGPSSTPTTQHLTHVGFYWTEGNRGVGWTKNAIPPLKGSSGLSIPSPPAIWQKLTRDFVTPTIADAERLQGFPAGWTESLERVRNGSRARWRLLGNAVSVPVAAWLGSLIASGAATKRGTMWAAASQQAHNAARGAAGSEIEYVKFEIEGGSDPNRSSLSSFNYTGRPLSKRAATGFLMRYVKSSLRQNMDFCHDLATYCDMTDLKTFKALIDKAA